MVKKRKRYKSSVDKHRKKEVEDHPPPKRLYILTRMPRLGGSYEQTVARGHSQAYDEEGVLEDSVDPKTIERHKQLRISEVRSRFYSKKARREHHFETETLQRPEIKAWFENSIIKPVLKEHVRLLYHALLGHIKGRHPEYLMTVILDIIYYTHDEWFEPASFVKNFNPITYFRNYYFVWDIIREKGLRSFKTTEGIIELKFKRIKKPIK